MPVVDPRLHASVSANRRTSCNWITAMQNLLKTLVADVEAVVDGAVAEPMVVAFKATVVGGEGSGAGVTGAVATSEVSVAAVADEAVAAQEEIHLSMSQALRISLASAAHERNKKILPARTSHNISNEGISDLTPMISKSKIRIQDFIMKIYSYEDKECCPSATQQGTMKSSILLTPDSLGHIWTFREHQRLEVLTIY